MSELPRNANQRNEPWLKNMKRAVPIAKTDFKNDGYGPIFDHYPLFELKQNEVEA